VGGIIMKTMRKYVDRNTFLAYLQNTSYPAFSKEQIDHIFMMNCYDVTIDESEPAEEIEEVAQE
jgi:hypothetical protein